MGVLCLPLLCCALLCNHLEEEEIAVCFALLSYKCLVTVNDMRLFLVGLRCVTMV